MTDLALAATSGTLNYGACAVTTTGQLVCWSNGSSVGVAGSSIGATPTVVDAGGSVTKVAMLEHRAFGGTARPSTCVIRVGGAVACTGSPMGPNVGGTATTFTDVAGVTDAIELAMDDEDGATACALRSDGRVLCWGAGTGGQLGRVGVGTPAPAGDVESLTDATTLAASRGVFCANSSSRGLVCWGDDHDGGLGRGIALRVRLLP